MLSVGFVCRLKSTTCDTNAGAGNIRIIYVCTFESECAGNGSRRLNEICKQNVILYFQPYNINNVRLLSLSH